MSIMQSKLCKSFSSTRLWKYVHSDWRKLMKMLFKRQIHKMLLTVLDYEDDYVDVHFLVLILCISLTVLIIYTLPFQFTIPFIVSPAYR